MGSVGHLALPGPVSPPAPSSPPFPWAALPLRDARKPHAFTYTLFLRQAGT